MTEENSFTNENVKYSSLFIIIIIIIILFYLFIYFWKVSVAVKAAIGTPNNQA